MDRESEQNEKRRDSGIATLDNSGYTLSRLGLVPGPVDDPQPQSEPFKPSPTPSSTPPANAPAQPSPSPKPAWRPSQTKSEEPTSPPEPETAPTTTPDQQTSIPTEEEFVRVTVKVPRALRDILRSCAKSTHQYQYVLVIEALAEFLVQLPEDMQRQLLRDVNGETIKKQVQTDVPTSTWKRAWKRWLGR